MTAHFRRVCSDALISAGTLAGVLGFLLWFDPRVREQLETVAIAETPGLGTGVQSQFNQVASVLFDAVRRQSIDQAPLMIFVVCTTILVLFMWRT